MKKSNVINLIRYYAEKNDAAFRSEALEIAKDFEKNGDPELAHYVMSVMAGTHLFSAQSDTIGDSLYLPPESSFERLSTAVGDPFPLPKVISNDLEGIANVILHHRGLNRFLFQGKPGTGKTESVKQLARVLGREVLMADFSRLIDSRLGQTQKNVVKLFRDMKSVSNPDNCIFLFDEIDAAALDRINGRDLREMGRVTSAFLRELDNLPEEIALIATTNLFDCMDAALVRRFDIVVDFNRYSQEDLKEIAETLLAFYIKKYRCARSSSGLFRKILGLKKIPMPSEVKNNIRLATALSVSGESFDYIPRLYSAFVGEPPGTPEQLRAQGFTLREIEILTGISRSKVARELKERTNE